MRSLLVFSLAVLFASPIYSEDRNYESAVGIDATVSVPTGNFSYQAGTGYGVKATYTYMFGDNFGLMAELGFLNWSERGPFREFGSSDYNAFVINAGLKMRLIANQPGPYVFSTLGVHLLKYTYDHAVRFEYGYGLQAYSFSGSSNNFNLAAGAGSEFALGGNVYVDTNVNYNHIFFEKYNRAAFDANGFSYIGVSVGLLGL